MSIDKLRTHYGLSRTPFSRGIAPSQIFQARAHKEAVARLRWLIDETAIGVVTGEVGAGKTLAARACVRGGLYVKRRPQVGRFRRCGAAKLRQA